MNRLIVACLFLLVASLIKTDTASAQFPNYYGFLPYGFYQPYGARYGTSVSTPPYFSLNPPVYYGARHARPYGLSPFASPPQVYADKDYKSRLRTQFKEPLVPTPGPAPLTQPPCNHCLSHSSTIQPPAPSAGVVRFNPYVKSVDDRLVQHNPFVE